jgi:hypothetical protein
MLALLRRTLSTNRRTPAPIDPNTEDDIRAVVRADIAVGVVFFTLSLRLYSLFVCLSLCLFLSVSLFSSFLRFFVSSSLLFCLFVSSCRCVLLSVFFLRCVLPSLCSSVCLSLSPLSLSLSLSLTHTHSLTLSLFWHSVSVLALYASVSVFFSSVAAFFCLCFFFLSLCFGFCLGFFFFGHCALHANMSMFSRMWSRGLSLRLALRARLLSE